MPTRRRRSKSHLAGLLVLVGFIVGCGNPPGAATSTSQTPGSGPGINPSDGRDDNDQSLKTEEYVRLGLPAPDKVWSGEDMLQANKVFATLALDKPEQLPRLRSSRSGDVFDRLTSIEFVQSIRSRDDPLNTRLMQGIDYVDGLKEIVKKYTSAFLNGVARDVEVVALNGTLLRLFVLEFELLAEFVKTLDKEDPTYAVRMQGMEQTKSGLAQVVNGHLMTLTERDRYRPPELIHLVEHMQETFPALFPYLAPAAGTDALTRLVQMQDDPHLQDMQPGLGNLLEKLRETRAKGPLW